MLTRLRGLSPQALVRRARVAARPRAVEPDADVDELLRLACLSFVQLQAAWDRADLRALSDLATAALLADLRDQLALRGPGPNCTEVVKLHARLLSMEELREAQVASVEFSGLIRERSDAVAAPFRELWLLAHVKAAGPGWKLARVQSLC